MIRSEHTVTKKLDFLYDLLIKEDKDLWHIFEKKKGDMFNNHTVDLFRIIFETGPFYKVHICETVDEFAKELTMINKCEYDRYHSNNITELYYDSFNIDGNREPLRCGSKNLLINNGEIIESSETKPPAFDINKRYFIIKSHQEWGDDKSGKKFYIYYFSLSFYKPKKYKSLQLNKI